MLEIPAEIPHWNPMKFPLKSHWIPQTEANLEPHKAEPPKSGEDGRMVRHWDDWNPLAEMPWDFGEKYIKYSLSIFEVYFKYT